MKKNTTVLLAASLLASPIQAAIVTATTGNPVGAEGYAYHVELDPAGNDATIFQGTVGTWSWEDESLPGEGNFWRHQSDWLAVTLTEDSVLRIQAQRNDPVEDIKLFPSFTIYKNLNDTNGGSHFSSNKADLQWEATSQPLEYLDHHDNSIEGSIDQSMTLQAGNYTILLGGNAPSQDVAENRNYLATLSVSPIPEQGTATLGLLGMLSLLSSRKR